MPKELVLISSSYTAGGGYLGHGEAAIKKLLGNEAQVAFVPYALQDHDAYTTTARDKFTGMGYKLISVHEYKNPREAILNSDAVFIGGGNSFRLLNALYSKKILHLIYERVANGEMKFIGTSAGTNMACPTLKTTNDMPIVRPPSFNALGLIDYQINPHFVSGSLVPNHMGETREKRIEQFHEEKRNKWPVIGLTEANWITVNGNESTLHGERNAIIFEQGKAQREWLPETLLSF